MNFLQGAVCFEKSVVAILFGEITTVEGAFGTTSIFGSN